MNTKRIITLSLYVLMVAPFVYQTAQADVFNQNVFNTYCAYNPAAKPYRFSNSERDVAYARRLAADRQQNVLRPANNLPAENNGDEQTVPDFAAQFSKLFDHDPVTSVLTPIGQANYQAMVKALATGQSFNNVSMSASSQRKWENPQAAFMFTMEGCDSSLFAINPAPKLTSPQAAADMIEIYLQAVCRDVEYSDYGTGSGTDVSPLTVDPLIIGTVTYPSNSLTAQAAAVLNSLPAYVGPKDSNGNVTPAVLFRGTGYGTLNGPLVSQFLLQSDWIPFPSGGEPIANLIGANNLPANIFERPQLIAIASPREFGVSWDNFIAIQNGMVPQQYNTPTGFNDFNPTDTRYIITGRDLAHFVHTDTPISTYVTVLCILGHSSFALNPGSPYLNGYYNHEYAGASLAGGDAFTLIGTAFHEATKVVFAQKWRADRRLRPEAMAGLFNYAYSTSTNPYNLDSSLFNSTYAGVNWLQLVYDHNSAQYSYPGYTSPSDVQNYLLGLVYPEGSPAHPSYPQAHGTLAGACITVIKAIYDDTQPFAAKLQPVQVDPSNPTNLIPYNDGANPLTLGSELNKLAFNIAIGRQFGGVHYPSDTYAGVFLGEELAIRYLQDHARLYNEPSFNGYAITKLDGTRILITQDSVTPIF